LFDLCLHELNIGDKTRINVVIVDDT